jgi:hypothetical protein
VFEVLFITCIVGLVVLTRTQLGREFLERLVERLTRLTLARLVLLLLTASAATALLAWLKTDGAFMLARAVPEGMAWFAAFDVGLFVDAFALSLIVVASLRLRATWLALRDVAARLKFYTVALMTGARDRLASAKRSRERRRLPHRPPRRRDGEDPGPALAFA